MKSRFTLDRRTLLRGIAGSAIALPALEAMEGALGVRREAHAQSAVPKRLVVLFGGSSLGRRDNQFVPPPVSTPGALYALTPGLRPLGNHGDVRSEVSVVSGMRIPWAATGAAPPAGGRVAEFHASSVGPLLSGLRSTSRSPTAPGRTVDQIVADSIGASSRFRSLVYRAQPISYRGGDSYWGRIFVKRNADGTHAGIEPIVSPRLAFDQLFSTAPTGATPDPRRALLLRQDRSVLDLVRGSTERLMARLGTQDRARLALHLEEIRQIERRIAELETMTMPAACMRPTDPGADPRTGLASSAYTAENGYSEEDRRAQIMCDLIHMAFVCDLTRVASLAITFPRTWINCFPLTGIRSDLHEIGHGNGSTTDMANAIAWHVKHYAYLIDKFRSTPQATGTLLDHSALVFTIEAGHGFDPEGNRGDSPHSTENMAMLIAGRVGGMRHGRHIVATNRHPASVLVSAKNAVGVAGGLGDVSDRIEEVFATR